MLVSIRSKFFSEQYINSVLNINWMYDETNRKSNDIRENHLNTFRILFL